MRTQDRTAKQHDKPIGKRNLRRQSRLFNDNGRSWWLRPGLCLALDRGQEQGNPAKSSVVCYPALSLACSIYLHLPMGTMLFDWSWWVSSLILWIHHTSPPLLLLLTVRFWVCPERTATAGDWIILEFELHYPDHKMGTQWIYSIRTEREVRQSVTAHYNRETQMHN